MASNPEKRGSDEDLTQFPKSQKDVTQHKIFRYRELFRKCVAQKDGRTMMVYPDRAIMTDPLVDTRLVDGPFPELDGERNSYDIVSDRRCEVAIRWREFYNHVMKREDAEMSDCVFNYDNYEQNRAIMPYLRTMMMRWND